MLQKEFKNLECVTYLNSQLVGDSNQDPVSASLVFVSFPIATLSGHISIYPGQTDVKIVNACWKLHGTQPHGQGQSDEIIRRDNSFSIFFWEMGASKHVTGAAAFVNLELIIIDEVPTDIYCWLFYLEHLTGK